MASNVQSIPALPMNQARHLRPSVFHCSPWKTWLVNSLDPWLHVWAWVSETGWPARPRKLFGCNVRLDMDKQLLAGLRAGPAIGLKQISSKRTDSRQMRPLYLHRALVQRIYMKRQQRIAWQGFKQLRI